MGLYVSLDFMLLFLSCSYILYLAFHTIPLLLDIVYKLRGRKEKKTASSGELKAVCLFQCIVFHRDMFLRAA